MCLRKLTLASASTALKSSELRGVVIVSQGPKAWSLEITAYDPAINDEARYVVVARNGKPRTWADPRRVIVFLKKNDVSSGFFRIDGELSDYADFN